MIEGFGNYLRGRRETLNEAKGGYSLRKVADQIGVEPSYLSRVEREKEQPPSEAKIRSLAEVLGEDPDVLLAMAGKVSTDLQEIIIKRPRLFSELLRQLRDQPDHALLRVVREVRDGTW